MSWGRLDFEQKLEIIKAVQSGQTKDRYVSEIFRLYNLLQLGIAFTLDDFASDEVEALLYMSEEIQRKMERDAKMRKM